MYTMITEARVSPSWTTTQPPICSFLSVPWPVHSSCCRQRDLKMCSYSLFPTIPWNQLRVRVSLSNLLLFISHFSSPCQDPPATLPFHCHKCVSFFPDSRSGQVRVTPWMNSSQLSAGATPIHLLGICFHAPFQGRLSWPPDSLGPWLGFLSIPFNFLRAVTKLHNNHFPH